MRQFKHIKIRLLALLLLVFIAFFLRERSYVLQIAKTIPINDLAKADCGVVLTGSPGRIPEAFEVLILGKVDKLIISGVYKDTKLQEIFPQLSNYPAIKFEDIILEKISGSTYQNAEQSLLLVQSLKCRNILLITSKLHMHRAFRTFRVNFPESIEVRSYATVNSTKEDSELAVFFETIKAIFYSIMPFV